MNFGLKIGVVLLLSSLLIAGAAAQEDIVEEEEVNALVVDVGVGGTNIEATGVDCFDYYDFGSVGFELLRADKLRYSAGDTAHFITTIKNNNPYPLVEGGVLAQVYWLNTESGGTQGDNLIDEFWVMEGLTLDKNQGYPLAFSWKIPKRAVDGYYYVALFFQVKKSFNMSGLPFINNVYGGSAGFTIENGLEKAPFYFDRNTVRLQGAEQMLRNFSQSFTEGEEITYAVSLKNPNSEKTSSYVEYSLFDWDQTGEENLLAEFTKKEFLEIDAESQTDASISLAGLKPGAYLLKIYSESNAWYSSINLRFSVEGEKGRFVFSGLDKFPLAEGDGFTLFSCFSNSTDWFSNFGGRVEIELTAGGEVIGTAEYSGEITPKIIAVKEDLTAGKEYDKALLTSRIYGSDNELDQEITVEYDFAKFRTQEAYDKYFGPQDSDGDGIPDEEDACPDEAGTLENGCPEAEPTPEETATPTPEETAEPEQPLDMAMVDLGIVIIIVIVLIVFFIMKGKK